MAPAYKAHSCRIYNGIVRDNIITSRKNILILEPSVVYSFIKFFAVSGTSSVIRSHNNIALYQHLPNNLIIGTPKRPVNSAMRKNEQRILATLNCAFRNKNIGIK